MPVVDVLDESAGPVLALRVSGGRGGGLEPAAIARRAEEIALQHGAFRLLVLVEGLGMLEAASLRSQMSFVAGLAGRVERVAVVGDQGWLKTALRSAPLPGRIAVKHFSSARVEDAREWVKSL